MIRKLTSKDHEAVFVFLKEESSMNLFIIGDIEQFGYDADFQELWGDFDEHGELKAVLLRFYNSFIPYAKASYDVEGFAEIIRSYSGDFQLSGKSDVVEPFEGLTDIPLGKKRVTYFAECKSTEHVQKELPYDIRLATIDDVDRIMDLRSRIDEFQITPSSRDMLIKSIETNTGRTYVIEEDGKIVSSASTAAENSFSAMIVAVCTDKEYRQKGYASAILQRIISDLIQEGKYLCLFYDNPDAGKIYKRLGFQDIGTWTMYR
ncbi:GNAT family N-acetyltransferase [Aeribacillus pallidus]|uniref:GNAT family N-acetyltransferase n=1 Tax=Aeribacillus pallidus TaxID=33936 RepID=UPI003D1FDE9B